MSDKYLYGELPAEVESAARAKGVLIRTLEGAVAFCVYHDRERFTDYEIRHDDLGVTIDTDALAAFYRVGERDNGPRPGRRKSLGDSGCCDLCSRLRVRAAIEHDPNSSPMPNPKRPVPNPAREHRISEEIVVDAYGPEERAMGWYYYLEQELTFPFKARCTAVRSVSPLKKGEVVEVLGMAKEDDCMREAFVLIRFGARKLGVPLAQLEPVGADAATREAAADWGYWTSMGYEF